MAFLLPRSSQRACYYCHNAVASAPSSPLFSSFSGPSRSASPQIGASNFHCPHCGCWNRYNAKGEIIGDEPAMRDENLNSESFAKRGSPDRNHFPSTSGKTSLFCRACLTNQTLLVNLLANYLPDDENDPSYASRLAALPAYTTSLQSRYPPVCPSCLPAVEDEIARKDTMARTRALGGALKESHSRGKGKGRAIESNAQTLRRLAIWKVRGGLWVGSLLFAVIGHASGICGLGLPDTALGLSYLLPFATFISIFWTLWDPTYSLRQRSGLRGKQIRVDGRSTYMKLQLIAWMSRVTVSSLLVYFQRNPGSKLLDFRMIRAPFSDKRSLCGAALALEILVSILSYFSIRIHRPAPIRLIDSSASRALSPLPPDSHSQLSQRSCTPALSSSASTTSTAGGISEPDLFATLSLSPNPVIANYAFSASTTAVNPMFGMPSLQAKTINPSNPAQRPGFDDDDGDDDYGYDDPMDARDPNAMDWEPSTPYNKRKPQRPKSTDDGTWLRPQRFFPPEEPTGLENLLMRTRLLDEYDGGHRGGHAQAHNSPRRGGPANFSWNWVYSLSTLPICLLLFTLWWSGTFASRTSTSVDYVPLPHEI